VIIFGRYWHLADKPTTAEFVRFWGIADMGQIARNVA
jgi:hypothetical protein